MNNQTNKINGNMGISILSFVLYTLLFILSLKFLLEGEVNLPSKGIILYGMHARLLATLMLFLSISPLISDLIKKIKRRKLANRAIDSDAKRV
jgi:hypothetical protein